MKPTYSDAGKLAWYHRVCKKVKEATGRDVK